MHPWAMGRDGTHRTVSETDRRGKPLKTVVCMETGLVRNDPVPGDDELARFYAEDYRKDYKASEKPRKRQILRNFRRVAAHVSQFHDVLDRATDVLDVGAGSGEFAYLMTQRGKSVTGIEPNKGYAAYCRDDLGLDVRTEHLAGDLFDLERFVEKPDAATAAAYLESGSYLWNSGMFLLGAAVYLEELGKHAPEILECCRAAMEGANRDMDFIRPEPALFDSCPSDSIDYAVMENTDRGGVVSLDCGWSDVGAWSALWDVSERDDLGNASRGDVILDNCKDSYFYSDSRLVAATGVDGLVVVETADAVLVADRDKVQDVKRIVNQLKAQDRPEVSLHRRVYRPWGSYESLVTADRFQVKRIVVDPGQRLSLQMHHHRAEHWIVVSGTAEVTCDDKTFMLGEDESTYIPLGNRHRLANPGRIPLELIEVQSGTYLGEDDIVRFDDEYGRGS